MNRRALITAAILSLVAFGLILSASWNDSPCFDEPEHITAGFTYIRHGIFFINPFHPPLVKDLAGLAVQLTLRPKPLSGWGQRDPNLCEEELFLNQPDPQTLVRVARAPIIALSTGFVALFFLTLWESRGYASALCSTLLLILSPTFLAHAGFVHNDVAAAGFVFLSLWLLRSYLNQPPDLRLLLAFALVAGAAQVVKFSCLVLYPVYLLAITLEKDRWQRWKHVPLTLLMGLIIINATYGVHRIGRQYPLVYRDHIFQDRNTPVQRALDAANRSSTFRPLSWYATGVLAQGKHVRTGHPTPTLMGGKFYPRGHWLYFPKLILLKIPLGLLALLLLGFWGLKELDRELRLYLLFGGVYLLVALASSLNLGIRHLLPIFPGILAVAGSGLSAAWTRSWFKGATVAAFLSLALSTGLAYPNFLPYFNLLSGDRIFTVDSNYDWGTDLYRLQERAHSQHWRPLHLYYFGSQPVARAYLREGGLIMDLENLPKSGYVAASASLYLPLVHWLELELPPEQRERQAYYRRWVESLREVEKVGTIQVFSIGEQRDP